MTTQLPEHAHEAPADGHPSSTAQTVYEGRDLEILAVLPNYHDWIIDSFRPWLRGRAMEIGAGIGTISRKLLAYVEHLDFVEPSANLAPMLSPSLTENKNVSFYFESLEDRLPQLGSETYDSIVMVNVLEHIENDDDALNQIFSVLKPGGHLLLFVPAMAFLFSEIDRIHGHYRRYHLGPLAEQLENSGFHIVSKRYFDMAGVLPWWLINTIGKKTDFDPKMMAIYDRFVIPVSRLFERWVSPPLGRNIIIVAEKKPMTPVLVDQGRGHDFRSVPPAGKIW